MRAKDGGEHVRGVRGPGVTGSGWLLGFAVTTWDTHV
jgi:hypothetical protein